MKLHEVLDLSKKPERSEERHDAYVNRLKRSKKLLGRGVYASVFQHPTMKNVAVKVARRGSAALDFIKYAIKNQDNPYIPKIYDVRKFRPEKSSSFGFDDYFIVFMEKLRPYATLPEKRKREILFYHLGLEPIKEYLYSHERVTDMLLYSDRQKLAAILDKQGKSPQLAELLRAFSKMLAGDLHDGNIMLRGRDQLVFVDPAV